MTSFERHRAEVARRRMMARRRSPTRRPRGWSTAAVHRRQVGRPDVPPNGSAATVLLFEWWAAGGEGDLPRSGIPVARAATGTHAPGGSSRLLKKALSALRQAQGERKSRMKSRRGSAHAEPVEACGGVFQQPARPRAALSTGAVASPNGRLVGHGALLLSMPRFRVAKTSVSRQKLVRHHV